MQSTQKAATHTPTAGKTAVAEVSAAKIQKLAAHIEHHHHHKEGSKPGDASYFVELKGNKHVSEHLGISIVELEQCYMVLSKDLVVKRHGEHRVEILNKSRLAEIAKHAK